MNSQPRRPLVYAAPPLQAHGMAVLRSVRVAKLARQVVGTCLLLAALLPLGGCASFKERYAQNRRDGDAYNHMGPIKPMFDADGYYTGYTQKIKGDTYYHAPNGMVTAVRRADPRGNATWVDHYDGKGRLIKKTFDGYISTSMTYHYGIDGTLLGSTTRTHKEEQPDFILHIGPDGRRLFDQENLPWVTEAQVEAQ